ncbi:phage tail protein [Rheinheimera soli]|uniref:Fibronectin type-III domain-containing protein n=1 Tax=Rheinheimera soli TaxID=443616 RepID=A0ABU1VW07_9GAMM|nr:phage tail protein [Rheinheimera soli]MDR7119770.1 hypothetical protein [Rheinheimera soli]
MGLFSGIWKAVTKPFKKILSWLVPTPDTPGAQAVTVEKQGSDHAIPIVYGTRRIGGIKVHKYVTDADGGAKNEFLHLIIVFCEGPIEAISELFFDGVSEVDPRWNKDGGGKWFTVQRCNGTDEQAALSTGIPNWTAAHRLQGLAYIHLRLQMDESQSVWRGEPEVTARIAGRKIYDPRNGQTSYSENLPLHLLDYLTNTRYGKGLSLSRLMQQSFIESAHWADEQIISDVTINGETSSVTHARISGNHVIDTGKSVFSNVKQMLAGMRGMMPIGSGQLRLVCEKEGDPVFFFGHNKSERQNYALITSPVKSKAGRKNDRYNRVIIRFPNKLTNYERDEVHFPDANDPLFVEWLAEDNGVLLEQPFEFDTITNKAEAYQMAEIVAKRSRNRMDCSFTASPPAIVVEPGDIVGISDDTRGWDEKPFRVEQCKLREDGDVDFEFVEHQNAIYPWSGVAYSDRVGGTNLGDPTNIPAPTGLSIVQDPTFATGGRLTWSAENNAFIRRYRVQIVAGETEVFNSEVQSRSIDLPLLAPNDYVIRIYAVSSLGTFSPAAVLAFSVVQPVVPTSLVINPGNFQLEVLPQLAGIGLGTEFEFALNTTDDVKARGISMIIAGLNSDTEYTVFARTVNALGVSGWISGTATTLKDPTVIMDLIRPEIESIFQPVAEDLQEQIDEVIETVGQQTNDLALRIKQEQISRQNTDKQLFDTAAAAVRLRMRLSADLGDLTSAVFEVDPATGQIRNRAFAYTDNTFTQASLLIDGVNARVDVATQRLTVSEDRITNAESQITLQAGQIELRATYTDVTEQIAGALEAIQPAYSFGFFDSAEGWAAVTGTLTPGMSQISLTLGDIRNSSLNYSADDNPIVTISIERTAGTGWQGDLEFVIDGVTRLFAGVIEPVEIGSVVRTLNLSANELFTGTVTSVRLLLGDTTADTFVIRAITLGKPTAALLQLEGLSAQVVDVGIQINAIEASLTNYVTTAYFNDKTLTQTDVQTTISGWDSTYSVLARLNAFDENGTLTKANTAAQWVSAADANITSAVTSFVANGGLDDAIDGQVDGRFNAVQESIDAVLGQSREQLLSISRLRLEGGDLARLQFFAEYELYKLRNNLLEDGSNIALADRTIQALATDQSALAQEILNLQASSGTQFGQINAQLTQTNLAISNETSARTSAITNLQTNVNGQFNAQSLLIQQAQSDADGAAEALAGIRTAVTGTDNQAQTELILQSTVNKAGQAFARAFLGTTTTNNAGAKKITGIVIDGEFFALELSGDRLILTNTEGVKKLYWDNTENTWVFAGKMVLNDNTVINSEEDIRARDGEQGPPGPQGVPGQVLYTWIKYADSAVGAGLSDNPTGKTYVGFAYNKATPTESNNAGDYTWSLIQGPQGNQGVVGPPGADGQPTYTWIKYSDASDGTGLYDTPTASTQYIGIAANKSVQAESNVKTDYVWSKFKGDQGVPGTNGTNGTNGSNGAGFYTLTLREGVFPSNANASADFLNYIGRNPVNQDHLVYRNSAGTVSSAKMYSGGSWVAPTLLINGSLIATGSIAGDKILAGTEISGPIVTGGLLRTAASGMRVETTNDGDYLIWAGDGVKNDANGIYWIKKNGTGFIKSQFFQGQIVESKMGSGSSTTGATLTLTASNHNSSGFAVEVAATGYVSAFAAGNQTSKSFTVRVVIKRNGLQIGVFDTRLSGTYEALEAETYWSGNVGGTVIDTASTSGLRNYTAEISMVGTASPFTLIARSGTIKTFENKLAS